MSDARWFEIEREFGTATDHFRRAAQLFGQEGLEGEEMASYRARMAFMHAMQCGHTSLESGLVRILNLLAESPPDGPDWHADLIARVSRPLEGRPAVLSSGLSRDAGHTRRFRHVAMRGYQSFEPHLANPAVAAAERLAAGLPGALAAFRAVIDPD